MPPAGIRAGVEQDVDLTLAAVVFAPFLAAVLLLFIGPRLALRRGLFRLFLPRA